MKTAPSPGPRKLLRAKELADTLGVTTRTLFRMRAMGELPAAVKLSERLIGWRPADIDRWLSERTEKPKRRSVRRGKEAQATDAR